MSRDLAVPNEGRVASLMEERGMQLFASSTDVADFGEDYRAYTGFDSVWLTAQTLKQLSPQQSMAMRQWVALGGLLRIFTPENTPAGENGIYGFGIIEQSQLKNGNLIDETNALHLLTRHSSLEKCLHAEYLRHTWKMRDNMPDIRHPPVLIMSFVIIFALLLGPVNILVAARRKQHSMILITTPVVSIAGSVILAMLIILKDGFGGTGSRITLAFLRPETHDMAIVQEQISRTGVLLSSSFKAEQDLTVYPVNVDQMFFDRDRSYHLENGIMSGSWFTSRTIQGQLLYQITPTREHVEIYPCPDNSNPPEIVSAVNDKIKTMFYCDLENKWWTIENLHTGAKKTMRPATRDEYKNWWKKHRDYAGAKTRTAMDRVDGAKGMFFAEVNYGLSGRAWSY